MATPASVAKKRAKELAAITEANGILIEHLAKNTIMLVEHTKKLDDILSILDAGENPPAQVEKPKAKPRTKKA